MPAPDEEEQEDDELSDLECLLQQQARAADQDEEEEVFCFEAYTVTPTTDEADFLFTYKKHHHFHALVQAKGLSHAYHHPATPPQHKHQLDAVGPSSHPPPPHT